MFGGPMHQAGCKHADSHLIYALEYRFYMKSTTSSCRCIDFATSCADEELLNNFYSITLKKI